jgi:coproporphyrinogen III oxidase-like Fe-S oxidoreductase
VQTLNSRDALEEAIILGLRLNRGISLSELARTYADDPRLIFSAELSELADAGLLITSADRVQLTPRGRLLSNEVFERFLGSESREIVPQPV